MSKLLIAAIHFYQRWISPLSLPSCRFVPSCSTYALQAIQKYGWKRGSFLAVKRILRCHPLSNGGFDPVP